MSSLKEWFLLFKSIICLHSSVHGNSREVVLTRININNMTITILQLVLDKTYSYVWGDSWVLIVIIMWNRVTSRWQLNDIDNFHIPYMTYEQKYLHITNIWPQNFQLIFPYICAKISWHYKYMTPNLSIHATTVTLTFKTLSSVQIITPCTCTHID